MFNSGLPGLKTPNMPNCENLVPNWVKIGHIIKLVFLFNKSTSKKMLLVPKTTVAALGTAVLEFEINCGALVLRGCRDVTSLGLQVIELLGRSEVFIWLRCRTSIEDNVPNGNPKAETFPPRNSSDTFPVEY